MKYFMILHVKFSYCFIMHVTIILFFYQLVNIESILILYIYTICQNWE